MVRLQRSVLSVPASSWHMIENAVGSPADVVLLDLEDSVAPAAKAAGRGAVIRALRELDWGQKPPACRVNALDTPDFYHDLIELVEAVGDVLSLLVVPKVHRPEDVYVVDTLLSQIETSAGLEPGRIKVEAQIESAQGLVNVDRIAAASDRLEALIFGPGDFSASIRMPMASIGTEDWWDEQYSGHRLHYAMSRVLVAARAAGIRAIDGPVANFRDLDALRRGCITARGLGFDGKWCIHPTQLPIVNDLFSPNLEEVAWAHTVVDAYQEALNSGNGAVSVGNTMVDAASIKMAQTTLTLAEQAGIRGS
ncbi:MAG: CoA ester lyase [Chloroflexota bacterium]|nr:CoA ester lyase [Chloroflexota bacterium]